MILPCDGKLFITVPSLCQAAPADEHALCQALCGNVPSAVLELVKTSQNWSKPVESKKLSHMFCTKKDKMLANIHTYILY